MNPYPSGHPARALAAIGAALSLLSGACTAQTAEPEGIGLRVSGFGTLGLTHTAAPPGWGFLRSLEQPASSRNPRLDVDSRLGLQLNYAASSQIEFVGQVLAMRRLPNAVPGDAVEWAFAAYRPTADLTLRAGRLNLDQFLMSDYRNVGFAYLYVRPPMEYYGTIPSNLDGADINRTWRSGDVQWRAKGFVGRSKTTGIPLNNVVGFALARESDGLLLRAGWSRANLARNRADLMPLLDGLDQVQALPLPNVAAEAAALRNQLDFAAAPLTYATLGISWEQAPWQFAAEVTRMSFGQSKVNAGYVSIGRRIGDLTLFGLVSTVGSASAAIPSPAWAASLAPAIGPQAAQQVQALGTAAAFVASQSTRQATYSLGTRWDIHPRMALKLQWDHVKIRANDGYLWSNATSDPGSANIATALLDFVF